MCHFSSYWGGGVPAIRDITYCVFNTWKRGTRPLCSLQQESWAKFIPNWNCHYWVSQQTELTQSNTPPTAITDSIILSKGTWSINALTYKAGSSAPWWRLDDSNWDVSGWLWAVHHDGHCSDHTHRTSQPARSFEYCWALSPLFENQCACIQYRILEITTPFYVIIQTMHVTFGCDRLQYSVSREDLSDLRLP